MACLAAAANETCRALGVAVAVRALTQQDQAEAAEAAWNQGGLAWQHAEGAGVGLGSRVAWSTGPPTHPLDRLATWTNRTGGQPGGAVPLSIARGLRAWHTAQAQDRSAIRPVGPT